uniref:ATP synthase F0 subunit 6 n=1 Tax=Aonchotheca putorii TaxID=1647945 RepID=UPI00237AC871|nr:ATP synthase F0 subunit 6 [Aonchotheca putorii]WBV76984.1 ATP synthase F0 subunit 6 [Aonchotheca putorii]
MLSIILLFLVFIFLYNSIFGSTDFHDMMYPHMELSGMMWNTMKNVNSVMSLVYFIVLLLLIPKMAFFKTRWNWILNKFMYISMLSSLNFYSLIGCMSLLVFIINFYSLFSFNWVPFSQSWLILIMTTMFLLTVWMYMIFTGGMKLFGEKIPISWYILNFMLWFFHNLSFFIRFISLPFRMMMNLIVGMFLVDFSKSLNILTSFISIYEIFVMMVQTLVFIILSNMYYTEMIILPEWKVHKSSYNFNFNIKLSPFLDVIKTFFIKMMLFFKKM